jgi:hypothetical protein
MGSRCRPQRTWIAQQHGNCGIDRGGFQQHLLLRGDQPLTPDQHAGYLFNIVLILPFEQLPP